MAYENNPRPQNDGCLDWEGEIQQEHGGFALLEPGIYPFTVQSFARERYTPREGGKLPPCNQARVTLLVEGVELEERFPLHARMEWKISQLYAALGMKRQGERVRMNWPALQGRSGYLELGVRTWQKRDGSGEGRSNEVRRFLAPWDADCPGPAAGAGGAQAGGTQTAISGYQTHATPWQAGKF